MSTTNRQRTDAAAEDRWSRFGWFGVLAGGSTWMLCAGVFVIANGETVAGMFPLASGLIILIVGAAVWGRRDRLSLATGMIIMLAVILLTVSIAIACTAWTASPDLLAKMRWPTNPIPMIAFLTLVLGGGIWMNYSRLKRSKRQHNAG